MEWVPGIVRHKRVWAPGLFSLRIEADVQPFEPGQFLQLGLRLPDVLVHRPYSVASPPDQWLEFFIVVVDGGQLTPHLWRLQVGDCLEVSTRAAGRFTLSKCPAAKTLWMVATGTGLAPYLAMLRQPDVWSRYAKVVLVHGVRHAEDQAYEDEIAGHSQLRGQQFAFVPVISRQQVPGALFGRITTCLADGSLESLAQAQLNPQACVMLCGNPDMLTEMESRLGERGLRRHRPGVPGQIVVERYW
jgi:ferredoxin--NADP+ reductase